MKNLKSHPMYWLYNILLLIYWATLIPMLIYRLIREEGFYQRIKQSIGFLPEELKDKISNRHAICLRCEPIWKAGSFDTVERCAGCAAIRYACDAVAYDRVWQG